MSLYILAQIRRSGAKHVGARRGPNVYMNCGVTRLESSLFKATELDTVTELLDQATCRNCGGRA